MKAFFSRGILCLLIAGSVPVCAQPQAPIEWAGPRLLMEVPYPPYQSGDVCCQGDTLVLESDYSYFDTGIHTYPAICISSDNGNTWSSWHIMGTLGIGGYTTAHKVGFNSTAIFCTAPLPSSGEFYGFYVTTDLGNTWRFPVDSARALLYRCQRGDTLFCSMREIPPRGGVVWTTDLGVNFSPPRYPDWVVGIDDIAVSASYVHIISNN